jgi:hypothetical protein
MRPREGWPVIDDPTAPGLRYDWAALAGGLADAGVVDRAHVQRLADLLREAHEEGYSRATGYNKELLWSGDREYEPGLGF